MEPPPKRLRLESLTPAYMDCIQTDSEVWLDLLPEEVCRRLAALIVTKFSNDPALSLAQTSSPLRKAVVSEVCHDMIRQHRRSFSDWVQILGDDLRAVNIVRMPKAKRDVCVNKIMRSPKLEQLQVCYDGAESLSKAQISSSVQSLTINSTETPPNPETLHHLLKSLNLHTLALSCAYSCGPFCIVSAFAKIEDWKSGRLCPNVTKLDINCSSFTSGDLITLLSGLPALREVTLHKRLKFLDDDAFLMLEKCEVINLANVYGVLDTEPISLLGDQLTSLRCCSIQREDFLTEEHISLLSVCKQLKALDLVLKPGAEKELLPICGNLRSLHLTWGYLENDEMQRTAYCPEVGVIERIVKQAPLMSDLQLLHISLCRLEIDEVLKDLGSRLREFKMSEAGHGELSPRRFEYVMQKLATHNPELRRFAVVPSNECLYLEYRELDQADIVRMMATVSVLRNRTKLIDSSEFYNLIRFYLGFMIDCDGFAAWRAYRKYNEIDVPKNW